jgi:hypothetical protein
VWPSAISGQQRGEESNRNRNRNHKCDCLSPFSALPVLKTMPTKTKQQKIFEQPKRIQNPKNPKLIKPRQR